MLSVEYAKSNCFIQHLLAKCQPFAKFWVESFHTKQSPLLWRSWRCWRLGGDGKKLALMHCGKHPNRGAEKYHSNPERDRLALPREIWASFTITYHLRVAAGRERLLGLPSRWMGLYEQMFGILQVPGEELCLARLWVILRMEWSIREVDRILWFM